MTLKVEFFTWVCNDLNVGMQGLERLLCVSVGELEGQLGLVPRQNMHLSSCGVEGWGIGNHVGMR